MKRGIFILWLTLVSFTSAYAQWSGSVKTDGAWNFRQSNSENAEFKLKYNCSKFYVSSEVYVRHSFLPSTQTTSILDAKKEENEYYKGEDKEMNPRKFNAGAGIDFGYIFNPFNTLGASLSYGYSGKDEISRLKTERYNNVDRSILKGIQADTSYFKNHNINAAIAYTRKFESRPDAHLEIKLTGIAELDADANRRITSGNFYPKQKNYATYSSLNDFKTIISAAYDDIVGIGENELKLKAGLDHISNQDIDIYLAETFAGGRWRDSTAYRQSYFYNSQAAEPYVNLTYTVGKFDFFVKERVQVYWHSMLDKYDTRNLLSAGITYRVNDSHRLMLDYSRSISRPDYKKLCPTLMIGKSEGEYVIGNPNLLPEVTDKINLGYTYTEGIFVTKLDINYQDRDNTAEKVIDLEKSKDITDPGVKTLYTWINNKRQNSFGSKLDLRINGRDVKAEIWAGFNYDMYWKGDKVDQEDFNYELGTSVDVFLNKTTKLSSSLTYISAKHSAYNLCGEDVVANLRFSKFLAEGLELYAELKDIVDKEVYEETWDAEMNHLKIVNIKPMQRAVLLGVHYAF